MTSQRFRFLLVAAVMAAAAVDAFPFAWQPTIQTPNPAFDVTSSYAVENLIFLSNGVVGADVTDVMPIWIDEDGNEIPARSGLHDPNGWNSQEFAYKFSLSDFRSNGEYTLLFPEGLLVNASGEKSDRLEWQFSFDVNEFAPPMFDDFKVVSVSPDFSQPQGIWNDQRVSVSTNYNESIGLTTLQLFDLTDGESLTLSSNYSTGRALGVSSPVEWDVIGSFKFFEGHDYRADFVFYNDHDQYGPMGEPVAVVDRVSYSFTGKVAPYAYSPVSLVEVTPAPGVSVISTSQQAVFTYVFSGPVTLYRAETPLGSAGTKVYPQSCISSNEDQTVWTLDLSKDSFLASQSSTVLINVYVRDADGVQLKGNEGSEGNSCFQYEWECELGASAIRIVKPDAGSTIDRLSEVVVRSSGGAALNWSWMGTAAIRNNDGEEIGRLSYDEGGGSEAVFTRWIPAGDSSPKPLDITKEGSYTVSFSHGCFSVGSESDAKQTRSASSSFYISGRGDVPPSYEDFKVISVSPDLQKPQAEWNSQTVTVNTNRNEAVGLVTLSVTDQTTGEYLFGSDNSATGRVPGNSSEISWSVPGSYIFSKGHSYNAEFIFYDGSGEPDGQPGAASELGRVSYVFLGSFETVQDDPFSKVSLESVAPRPDSFTVTSLDQAVFRYTFSGPVDVYKVVIEKSDGSAMEYPASCLSSDTGKTVWTLDLSDDGYVANLDGYLIVSLYVRDLDGLPLKGNSGASEDSCFRYEWDCMLGSLPLTVVTPENGSEVEVLTEVIVRSPDSLPLVWAYGSASILNTDGRVMGMLGYVGSSDADVPGEIRFSWWIPSGQSDLLPLSLDEKGDYLVSFSAGSFLIGNHPDLHRNSVSSSSFSVSGLMPSSVTLVGVEPAPGSLTLTSPDQAVFRYSFSGPVDVYRVVTEKADGSTFEYPASCLSSDADKTVWTLDLSAVDYVRGLDGMLEVSLYARDLDGRHLEGNYGEKENSCFRFEWDCMLGALPVEVLAPASGSVVEKLTEITVKSADGAPMSWVGGDAVLSDAAGVVLGRLHYSESSDIEASDIVRFSQWTPAGAMSPEPLLIESDGSYSVQFGFGCFRIGEAADARRSRPAETSFSVQRRVYSDVGLLGVDPEPMSEVISEPSMAVFTYTFSGPVNIYRVVTPLEDGGAVEYPLSCLSSVDDMSVWTLDLSAEEYLLALDAPLVIEVYARDLDGYPVKGNFGEEDDSCFRYEWDCTVGALPEAADTFVFDTVDPPSGSVVTSLDRVRIGYPAKAVILYPVVDVYGEGIDAPVETARLEVDPEDDSVVVVSLAEPVKEKGVYTLVFREAVVADEAFSDSEGKTGEFNPSFSLVYTVEPEDNAVYAVEEAIGQDVYDLHGRIVVRDADASAIRRLQKGVYVIKGKKIVIK